jgi:hypothetical protein
MEMSAQKVVINACFGGFGLSEAAYEKLIEWGVPVRRYTEEVRDETGLYAPRPENDREVIFDRELTPRGESGDHDRMYWAFKENGVVPRYWDTWTRDNRSHPLVVRVVEELGAAANDHFAQLRIVEIPAGVQYEVEEYDGNEHVAEAHRTWR